ncbi:MAG: hypothetical protein AAGF66_08445 [Cyanobacteria bacterium P01_H01_bin.119]
MAGTEDVLERLQSQLLTLDDDALAIASSKGLVRRAYKELQKAVDPDLQASGDCLTLTWPDHTVTLPTTNLLAATCTCPAADICRHILLSYLWLRAYLPTSPSPSTPPCPVSIPSLSYTLDDLTAWATKPTLRKGFAFLQRESPQIEGSDPIVVRFPQVNLSCRYSQATGLTGMLCACKSRQVCAHQVAAVLAILRSQGIELTLPAATSKTDAAIVTAAAQVIAHAQTLLEQTVAIGLLHLSEITQQQFVTLAVSAQGAKLPRLSLVLRGIASDIDQQLKRHAAADSDRLFERLAHTYALCAALQQTAPVYPIHLAGQAQSQYDAVGTLELIGLGAYPWRTASSYGGLTVLFWDRGGQRWCSWSESRPLFHRETFQPAQIYWQPGPWEGIAHPAEASRSCLRLSYARRNYQQRLSNSSQTVGVTLRPTQAADWQSIPLCFEDWHALRDRMTRTQIIGLAESNPLERLAILRPHRWGFRQFDPVQQQLTWDVFDLNDQLLQLRMRFTTDNPALAQLEQLNPDCLSDWGIIGSVELEQNSIYCHPIALCRATDTEQSAILNLHFATKKPTNTAATAPESLFSLKKDETATRTGSVPAIIALDITIQRLAERGMHGLDESTSQELARLASYAERVGMKTLAVAIAALVSHAHRPPAQLLKAKYLYQLYQQT